MTNPADQNSLTLRIDQEQNLDAYKKFLDEIPVRTPTRILFVAIPLVPGDLFIPETAKRLGYQAYPPLGFLYLAAAANLAIPGIEMSVLDLNLEMLRQSHQGELNDPQNFWKELIAQEIRKGGDLHICVNNNWEVMNLQFLAVNKYIRENFPEVTILTGGAQTTMDYQRLVEEDYCHVAFRYQSEMEFKSFLEDCLSDQVSSAPKGIAFKTEDRYHETNPILNPPSLLDIRPYYHLLPLDDYHQLGGMNPYSKYVGKDLVYSTILVNRGCRANCTFCGVKAFYPAPVLTRPAREVVDEMKFLVNERGVRLLDFLDDDLAFSQKGALELFQLMAEELPSDFRWISSNGITGSSISEELMGWIAKSGCKGFKVGVETGNEARMRKTRKPATKDRLRKAGVIFKKFPQVHVGGNYMLGFPEETFGELMETYDFANELSWDWANFYICGPAEGTPMFQEFADLNDERCEGDHFGGLIPARSAPQTGNFGYSESLSTIKSGRDIFSLPKDEVPSAEQLVEIWFTFNIETNFFNNYNFKPGGDVAKIVQWFESIIASYPRDASMSAMLAHGHRLLGNHEASEHYRELFHNLHEQYPYWQMRIEEFPKLMEYAGK